MGLRKFLCNITTTNKNHTKKIVNSMWKSMKRQLNATNIKTVQKDKRNPLTENYLTF